MENTFLTAFATSVFAAIITASGIYSIRKFAAWGQRQTTYFMYFASGILISASFLHIIPKALSMNESGGIYLLIGFFGLYSINHFLASFSTKKAAKTIQYNLGLIPLIAIGFHSFIDGFIYSITFTVSVFTGFLATAGMILHEFPEGIITYLLLIRAGFAERKAMLYALLAASFTTPLGMLVSYPVISLINAQMLGSLLSISAGALIYVGATHLLPRAEQEHKKYSFIALSGGIIMAIIIMLSEH